jgi:DNA-binding response OmpR family regulator
MEIAKELKKRTAHISLLYAEDDKKIQEQVTQFLRKFFPDVTVCDDGQAALEQFETHPYDLVVTDIKMPRLDGMALSKKIKQLTKKTKVVITSAFDDKALLIRSIGLHVDYYLVKPIDYENLLLILFRVVNEILIERKMETFQRHQQEIVDFQDNMILTIDAHKITSANQTFLHYFHIEDFNALKKSTINIADFFVDEAPYFFPKDKANWIAEMYRMEDNDFLVKTTGSQHTDAKIFVGRIGTLHTFNERIITLTEVTANLGVVGEKNETFRYFTPQTITRFFDLFGSELQRSKKYHLPLCVSMLRFTVPQKNMASVDTIVEILHKRLNISDFFAAISRSKLLIVHVDQTLLELRPLLGAIHTQLTNDVKIPSFFGVTQVGASDTVESVLKGVEKSLAQTEGKNAPPIQTHPDYDDLVEDEQQLIKAKLKKITSEQQFSFVYYYKGMKMENIIKHPYLSSRNTLAFPITKNMLRTLHEGASVYVGGTLKELYYIEAKVITLDVAQREATVGAFRYTQKLPTKRQKLRVEFDSHTPVFLITDNKKTHGQLADLSYDSLAVTLTDISGVFPGDTINISTHFDKKKLETVAEVYRISKEGSHYRMALLLFVDQATKNKIQTILTQRELQIAQEIKNLAS